MKNAEDRISFPIFLVFLILHAMYREFARFLVDGFGERVRVLCEICVEEVVRILFNSEYNIRVIRVQGVK